MACLIAFLLLLLLLLLQLLQLLVVMMICCWFGGCARVSLSFVADSVLHCGLSAQCLNCFCCCFSKVGMGAASPPTSLLQQQMPALLPQQSVSWG